MLQEAAVPPDLSLSREDFAAAGRACQPAEQAILGGSSEEEEEEEGSRAEAAARRRAAAVAGVVKVNGWRPGGMVTALEAAAWEGEEEEEGALDRSLTG